MERTITTLRIWRFPAGKRADTPGHRGAGVSTNTNNAGVSTNANASSNKKEKNASLVSNNGGKVMQFPDIFLITYLLFTREPNKNEAARDHSCKNRKLNR
jgi:hypothetical protein